MDASHRTAPATVTYLVERYRPAVGAEEIRSAISRIEEAVSDMARDGTAIRYVRSTLVPADEFVLCVFEAPSEDDVAEANRRAGVRFDRISAVVDVFTTEHTPSATNVAGRDSRADGAGSSAQTRRPGDAVQEDAGNTGELQRRDSDG
jgi:hypothetical protein